MPQYTQWLYVTIAVALIALALLALMTLAHLALSGAPAIARDGLRPGTRAPTWILSDTDGQLQRSPSGGATWQLILFADHLLTLFPDVAQRLIDLSDLTSDSTPNLLIASRSRLDVTAVVRLLGLRCPVINVPKWFYGKYNVRVMPYGLLIDPQGIVRDARLVNNAWQALTIWNIARAFAQLDPADPNKLANLQQNRS